MGIYLYLRISLRYYQVNVMEMPVKFEISVVQVGKSLKVTIPVEIARHMELKKGDIVEMWVDNSHTLMKKKK